MKERGERSMQREKWGAWAQQPPEIPAGEISERLETEVLVVGAGIAGLSCALSAAEGGAKVTVLEKFSHYTARGFNIGVVNSSLMRERGMYNDPDEVAREWIKRCGNRCDERIVRLFVDNSEPAMDWLLDILTRPEYAVRPEINGCVYRGETYREIYGT
ncbi:MAG: FAD-dependent oxidoreductase, partial [Oscillospiraceae bacterium]|nr:FAD-dependent oxidoreductase [Oscillospiraceae bacterium]